MNMCLIRVSRLDIAKFKFKNFFFRLISGVQPVLDCFHEAAVLPVVSRIFFFNLAWLIILLRCLLIKENYN